MEYSILVEIYNMKIVQAGICFLVRCPKGMIPTKQIIRPASIKNLKCDLYSAGVLFFSSSLILR